VTYFQTPKNGHQRSTIYHAIHHNFTTKTPHQNINFRKNLRKKALPPRAKKKRPGKKPDRIVNLKIKPPYIIA
jgi:hypothetical protein